MTKSRQSYTLDEDLSNWVKESGGKNSSEFVNEILREAHDHHADPLFKLNHIKDKINNLEELKKIQIQKLEKQVVEGNKKEREDAKKKIKEEKEWHQKLISTLQKYVDKIKTAGFLSELLEFEGEDIKDYTKLAIKFREQGVEVGGSELQKIIIHKSELDLENGKSDTGTQKTMQVEAI